MNSRSSLSALGCVVALTLASAVASAQPTQPARPASTPVVDATRHAAAQQRFERGLGLFDHEDYATALTEFRASLELYPSPNTRLYVGICLLRLGHLSEAHAELERTFAEARDLALTDPNYVDARDLAQHEISQLEPRLGRLVLRAPAPVTGTTVTAGSVEVLPAMMGIALWFDPGTLVVTARAPGYRDFRQTVQLQAGATNEVTVSLQRDPNATLPTRGSAATHVGTEPLQEVPRTLVSTTTGGGVRVAGFVVGGLGLLALGGFALLGNMAATQFDQVLAECRGRCADHRHDDEISQGETYQILANVSLGAGAAFTLAGVVMIAVGGPRVVEEGRTARSTLRPWFDASRGMMGVGGAF
ncbi:MAG: hypothetical protein U0326_18980 [Polyangiales bacterium]